MGPPIFIGGNAMAAHLVRLLYEALQWGHRFSSVEIGQGQEKAPRPLAASMGPPIFIGGNGACFA